MEHIVILRQPFFDMILSGEKTIESRFSMNKIAPFKKIRKGDILLLKETGGQVTAKAVAGKIEFFELTPENVEAIRIKFGKQIGTDKIEDWEETKKKKFCTLVWLENVQKVKPFSVPKSNGAGWIVLQKWV